MGGALFTGVTGLLAHQRRMDVVANNLANVNTIGYRGSRMLFQDLFSQTLEGGSAPVGNFGGTNPVQIGLGVAIGGVDVNFGQGSLFTTGVASDLAVQGNGFFVLTDGLLNYYTRDGSFAVNANGLLTDPATGMRVQGYVADSAGVIDPEGPIGDISIPVGNLAVVRATQNVVLTGNLNAAAADGTQMTRTVQVYDSLGTPRNVLVTFTKRAQVDDGGTLYNAWTWNAQYDGANDVTNVLPGETGAVLFDANGVFHGEGSLNTGTGVFTARAALPSQNEVSIPASLITGSSQPQTPIEFSLDFASVTGLADATDMTVASQDGFPRGVLDSFSVGGNGIITGVFTNGLTQVLGQIAIANFGNVGGLSRRGDNMFQETAASGLPQLGPAGTGGRGTVSGGVLEGSNVDLGTEFSNLIVTQRGFQANARTITAADAMLQEAVNLVR